MGDVTVNCVTNCIGVMIDVPRVTDLLCMIGLFCSIAPWHVICRLWDSVELTALLDRLPNKLGTSKQRL